MSGQDALALVPGRPLHDSLMRREQINRFMDIGEGIAAIGRGLRARTDTGGGFINGVPPGACVLCGAFPEGSLVREPDVAGLGNL